MELTILQAMTPEQAALFLGGMDASEIVLSDGLTLVQLMNSLNSLSVTTLFSFGSPGSGPGEF